MGNIFACIIRSQVSVLDIGSLSHNYVKRCASCGSRQYTSLNNCRFCGGRVYEVDHSSDVAGAAAASSRRRAAHNANVLSSQVNGAHSSIPVVLAHDPETNQIIRYVQDYRGQLVRISGPSPEGFRMRSDHPDYLLLSNSGRRVAGRSENDEEKDVDLEKLREELDLLPNVSDINTEQITDALDELNRMLVTLGQSRGPSPADSAVGSSDMSGSCHSTSGLRLRSIGSGRMTDADGGKVELLDEQKSKSSAHSITDHCGGCEFTQQDLEHAIDHTRQLVSCPVCLSEYSDPLTLPCGHSLCLLHIGDVVTKRSSCPICREAIPDALITIGHIMKGTVRIRIAGNGDGSTSEGTCADEAAPTDNSCSLTTGSQGRRIVIISNPSSASSHPSQECIDRCKEIQSLPKDIVDNLRNNALQVSVGTLRELSEQADKLLTQSHAQTKVAIASGPSNRVVFKRGKRTKKSKIC